MNEDKKLVEPKRRYEELVVKYLTHTLNDAEREEMQKLISTNQEFKRELSLSMAALAIADSVTENLI